MLNLNSMADVGTQRSLKFALGINDDGDIVGFMESQSSANSEDSC